MIELRLPYPPSTNDYHGERALIPKGKKRPIVIKYVTREGKQFQAKVAEQVREQIGEPPNLTNRLAVTVHEHYGPNGTPQDIDACIKPLLDAMELADVYVNDRQVDQLLVLKKRRAAIGYVDVQIKIL